MYRRPWPLLTALLLAALPLPARAQDDANPSPRRPYVSVSPDDFEQGLKDNLDKISGLDSMRGILDQFKDNPELLKKFANLLDKDMLERLARAGGKLDLNDPQTRSLFDNLLKNPGLVEEAKKKIPALNDQKTLENIKKAITPPRENPPEGGGPPEGDPRQPPRPETAPPPQPAPRAEGPEDEEDFGDTVKKWLERARDMEGIGELVRESPAIQDALESLGQSVFDAGADIDWDQFGVADRFGDVMGYADRTFSLFPGGVPNLGSLPTPQLPALRLPSFPGGGMFGGLPRWGTPGGGSASALGTFVLVLAMLAAFGLILWQVVARLRAPAAAAAQAGGWHLGPWPVDPSRVATRDEVIRAFEYLSLLRLGQAARTWNHVDIAVGLGGEAAADAARARPAADRLAALYEKARYAPAGEPLPGPALAEARRDLCLLAGVPTA